MNHYAFEFLGKLHSSAKPEDVATALARLFQVNLEDTLPLLDGRASFRREGLNEFTAKAYQQEFAKMGALGEVREIPQTGQSPTTPSSNQEPVKHVKATAPSDRSTSQSPACPKCHSVEINQTQCLACGIYFEKYYQAQAHVQSATINKAKRQPEPEIESLELSDENEEQEKATKWLSIAGLFLTVVFIADSYLHNVHALSGAGIDFGYWPFLVGHLLLLRACFLYAQAKGYSGLLGSLGLLSLAGLSILVLLPDRRLQSSSVSLRTLATAMFCILISVTWLAAFTSKLRVMDQITNEASLLSAGRHEYPSAELDDAIELFKNEQKEMRDFLEGSLAKLQEHSFRPNEVSEVADSIFAALARYVVWRNYQTYLHIENQQPLPTGLKKDWVKEDRRLFAGILEAQIERQNQPRLFEAKNNWMFGSNPELTNPFWNQFSGHLWTVYDQFRTAHRQAVWQKNRKQNASESAKSIDISLKKLSLPSFGKTTTTLTDHTITYSAPLGPLSTTPLTLAFYLEPFGRPFGKGGVLPTAVVISPDFPQKYLYGHFNVLENYSVAYLD